MIEGKMSRCDMELRHDLIPRNECSILSLAECAHGDRRCLVRMDSGKTIDRD